MTSCHKLSEPLTPQQKFFRFHAENPHVYDTLERLALDWARGLNERIGAQWLTEIVRYQISLKTTGSVFKMNNDHAAFYARLLLARNPLLAGTIKTRRSVADEIDWDAYVAQGVAA